MVKQEVYRKQGYSIQADEEQLRVMLEATQAQLNAPTQFKVPFIHSALNCLTLWSMDKMATFSQTIFIPLAQRSCWGVY